jgi:Flp pilus assembly protein TadG
VPLVAVSLVAICGFLAMAVDVGILLGAKNQSQNAADSAATAGARSLNGSAGSNLTNATTNAQNAAIMNSVMGQALTTGDITVTHGTYHYDTTNLIFVPQFPPVAPDNYNLTHVQVSPTRSSAFAQVFGVATLNVTAWAMAAHRPRDICMVLDFSGSMNNESDLWVVEPEYGSSNNNTSNNADPVYPKFGPYDTTFSPLAAMLCTSTDARVGRCNISASALGIPAMVNDFYQDQPGSAAIQAFNPAPATVTVTQPGGDNYLLKKNSTQTALTWADITGSSSTGFSGYPNFNGWTQGPGYWGKTFYIWPPDPTPAKDWRKKFFFMSDGVTPLNDDRKLFPPGGQIQDPPGNYVINYKAILAWISANCVQSSNSDPKPFPPMMRAGRLRYYDSIPIDVPASAYDHTKPNSNITNQDQRFWKEYIDYVLGVWRDPFGNIQHTATPACSMGGDYTAGSSTAGQGVQVTGPDKTDPNGRSYIDPLDNPKRPRHRFWFGPMTMVMFMADTGHMPGTAHDISMYTAKLGIDSALTDMQNNHPNDLAALILFSRPTYRTAGPGGGADPAGIGQFDMAQSPLTKDYPGLVNTLYYPPGSTATADVPSFSANGAQTPAAHSDYDANTATNYGLMLAYNQLSNSSYSGNLAGYGRKGASRLIILETDGMANTATGANFSTSVSGTTNNSYYKIGSSDPVWLDNPSAAPGAPTYSNSTAGQAAVNTATKLCAQVTDSTNGPGFATLSKPVLIHVIAFGAVLEPVASPPTQQADCMALCQAISTIGGTGFPSSVNATTDPNYYKLVIGTQAQRQSKMTQAFLNILDSDIPVSLVR